MLTEQQVLKFFDDLLKRYEVAFGVAYLKEAGLCVRAVNNEAQQIDYIYIQFIENFIKHHGQPDVDYIKNVAAKNTYIGESIQELLVDEVVAKEVCKKATSEVQQMDLAQTDPDILTTDQIKAALQQSDHTFCFLGIVSDTQSETGMVVFWESTGDNIFYSLGVLSLGYHIWRVRTHGPAIEEDEDDPLEHLDET
jgi:hypothetical protein